MAEVITDTYSDHDMQCPAEWENGFKEGLVTRWGQAENAASDRKTGNWTGSTFSFQLSDVDLRFRQQLGSVNHRFWTRPLTVKMTTRANRAALGDPFTVFVGPIIQAKPTGDLLLDITLGDLISKQLIRDDDNALVPWRLIRDCGLLEDDSPFYTFAVSENLDLDNPEPIIYGEHRRIPNVDPASPQGFEITPIYMGIWTRGATDYHTWLISGHAIADVTDANTVDADGVHSSVFASAAFLFPHTAAFLAEFGAHYVDIRSHTYGIDRRYALVLGEVGDTDADDCAAGTKTLTCSVMGVEPVGDGTGDPILDRFLQYKHFAINYIANAGPASYQSGDWLESPTWDAFGQDVPVIDEDSFDTCAAIGVERLPIPSGISPMPDYDAGYVGAAIIGAKGGDRVSIARAVADWNRSCGCRSRTNNLGQFGIFLLHPTQAVKDAAPLYTDAYEILDGTFDPDYRLDEHVNRQPFVADYEHVSGQWKTSDVATWDESVANYEEAKTGDLREYPHAPGHTMAYHLARLSVLESQHPPRPVGLSATIGPDQNDHSLGYLIPGDYIRYQHFASLADTVGDIRLAQVDRRIIDVENRTVRVIALDCEDLIDYDAPAEELSGGMSPLNETCDDALVVEPVDGVAFNHVQDTSSHATDSSMTTSPPNWSGGEAYHAAWFEFDPPSDGTLQINTLGSEYDTKLAVFSGSCGSLTEDQYNDNYLTMPISLLEFEVFVGTPIKFLVAGYGPNDGGRLQLNMIYQVP